MYTLDPQWFQLATKSNNSDIIAFPQDVYLDREGDVRKTFETGTMELYFLHKEHEALQMAFHKTDRGGCLKQSTGAILISGNKVIGGGANAGQKMNYCKRVQVKAQTGEGYEFCRDVNLCNQIEHAEVMTILDAFLHIDNRVGESLLALIRDVNAAVADGVDKLILADKYRERNNFIFQNQSLLVQNQERGLDLVLYGHWWCCHSCMGAMISAGVKRIYLMVGAKEAFDPHSKTNILPVFNEMGQVV